MARARHSDDYAISLFPMFNILICTLGILIFILGALATLALGAGRSVLLNIDDSMDSTVAVHGKMPWYIEWDGSTLTAHPSKESLSFDEELNTIETFEETYAYIDTIVEGSYFEDLFLGISVSGGQEYVVLLVRPSGFDSLYEIRGYIETWGIDLGYEPLMQSWGLRVPE